MTISKMFHVYVYTYTYREREREHTVSVTFLQYHKRIYRPVVKIIKCVAYIIYFIVFDITLSNTYIFLYMHTYAYNIIIIIIICIIILCAQRIYTSERRRVKSRDIFYSSRCADFIGFRRSRIERFLCVHQQ